MQFIFTLNKIIVGVMIVASFMSLSALTIRLSSCNHCHSVIITSIIRTLIILFPFLSFFILMISGYYWEQNQKNKSILISFLPYLHLLIIKLFISR